jgi:hypothetical protein
MSRVESKVEKVEGMGKRKQKESNGKHGKAVETTT